MFRTYVPQNPGGKFYVGHSDNLSIRLDSHNDSGAVHGKYTHKHGPWTLVWSEQHPDRASAMTRERQIKAMKSAKWIRENLLNGKVPTRRD